MISFPGFEASDGARGQQGTGPLVPLLRIDEGLGDPVALSTWHEALSDTLAAELPHDLLGLWLYPATGGVVLLGPDALAADDLAIPLPSPQLDPVQLDHLAEIVRNAGYASTVCLPIRFGKRDVGLLLVADLRAERFGEPELHLLRSVAQRVAPSFGRIARLWGTAHGSDTYQLERVAALLEALAQTGMHAGTPQLFIASLSRALEPLLPHDRIELLLADPKGGRCYRLGEHAGGPLWCDPSLVLEASDLAPEALFGSHDRVVLGDACRDSRWLRGYFTVTEPAGAELRAMVGARVTGPRGLRAYLIAGSIGPDLYDEHDAALLARVSGLIAPQVGLFVASAGAETSPAPEPKAHPDTGVLLEVSQLLALNGDLSEATRRTAEIAGRFLPFDEMRFAIPLSQGDRVVLLGPGERRPLPDLPLIPVGGTALGQVLQGELPYVFIQNDGAARLVVPLRVSGRVHGALVFTAAYPAVLREAHAEPAMRLADIVAPHLELVRRAALLPPPYFPGWKRGAGK
jgi:hypothetical protein